MSDDDVLLEQHRSLRNRMRNSWNAFFGGFGRLRPVQLAAMPPLLSGRSTLITAPTAGGKTEAVMAPIAERITTAGWTGLSVLLITPTQALVNDLFNRLARPLDLMRIRLGRKTGDHGLSSNASEQVLITTPESTESLLTFRREVLNSVQAVVLDEIHLLDGSPRGDHLRLLLARLSAYRRHIGGPGFAGLQRVAMSATVSEPQEMAARYLGEGAEVIAVGGQRDLEARIIVAGGTDKQRAEAAVAATAEFPDIRKILVFVNSRKQVDVGASDFRCGPFSKVPVYGHHGSLSKENREEVEQRFKSDSQAICVATMTLEVGIDIGDVDLVICMDPPFSLPSFLQRIGRGCRRLAGRTRVLCVARDRAGELMFESLVRQAALGMPRGPVTPFRRSVLVQQTLAYLRQVNQHRRSLDQFVNVFASSARPPLPADLVRDIVDDMSQSGLLDIRNNICQPAAEGWSFIESDRIYSNIRSAPFEVQLVDVETGRTIAGVAGVHGQAGGIRVAGRSYELMPGGSGGVHRVRAGGQHVLSPKYHAQTLPYAFDIGACLSAKLGLASGSLAHLRVGDSWVVFTWLGRLLNAVLAAGLRAGGHRVTEGAFHLIIPAIPADDLLETLRQAVRTVLANNPLGTISVERLTDLGPHFRCLSPSQQQKAQKDWLDGEFLTNWIEGITEVIAVPTDSDLGRDLLAFV